MLFYKEGGETMNISCCKDCPDRHRACHDTCERYQAAKEIRAADLKDIKDRYRNVRSRVTININQKKFGRGGALYGK